VCSSDLIGAGAKILSSIFRERLLRPLRDIERNRIIVCSRLPQTGNTGTRMVPARGYVGAADLQGQMARPALATVDRTTSLVDCECEDAEPQPWLSVVIPTLNEEPSIVQVIRSARQCPGAEIIVVDGGSTDATLQLSRDHGAKVIQCEPGRGRQLARGADAAKGDVLLFLHADTRLPFEYAGEIQRTLGQSEAVAGAFRMAFDRVTTPLRLVEWGADLRSTWRQMPYGDQAIYLRRSTYHRLGGFRPLDAMEDFDLVWRLRRLGRVRVSRLPAVTSARKYTTHGPWRTVLLHQWMIWSWLIRKGGRKGVRMIYCPTEMRGNASGGCVRRAPANHRRGEIYTRKAAPRPGGRR